MLTHPRKSNPRKSNPRHWKVLAAAMLLAIAGLTGGCATKAQSGALIGSGVGAAAGAGIDHRNRGRGALIGAGIGALGGYIIGNEADKADDRARYNSYGHGNRQGYGGGSYGGGYGSSYDTCPPPGRGW